MKLVSTFSRATILISVIVCCTALACDDDAGDELKMSQVKSMAVGLNGAFPQELSIKYDLLDPLKKKLVQHGVEIDQANQHNLFAFTVDAVKTTVGTSTIYSVSVSSRYREPCVQTRTKDEFDCDVWSDYSPMAIFSDPQSLEKYVSDAVAKQTDEFMKEFGSK